MTAVPNSTVVYYCIALYLLNECQYLPSRQECDNQLCSFILFFNAKKVRPIAVYRWIKITVYIYSNEMILNWLTSYISVWTSAVYRWEMRTWIFSLLSLLWIHQSKLKARNKVLCRESLSVGAKTDASFITLHWNKHHRFHYFNLDKKFGIYIKTLV